MNKKIVTLIIVLVLAATLVLGLSACDMFVVNGERDYYQVVATVNYNGLSKDIYKGELLSYVNSYGSSYMSNYSMTLEEVVDYFYDNLTRQALLNLKAREYLYENTDSLKNGDKAMKELALDDYLTVDELRYCVESTNSQFKTSFESILENIKVEDETEDEETEDESDELAARTQRTEEEESTEYKKDETFTAEYIQNTYNKSVNEYLDSIMYFNTIGDEIKAETDSALKKDMKSALTTLNKNLENSYLSYEYFYNQQKESRILAKYQDAIGEEELAKVATSEITNRYTKLIDTDKVSYEELTAYTTALGTAGTFVYYHNANNYFAVKSILLKFSEEQSNAITYLSTIYGSDSELTIACRDYFATGLGTMPSEVVSILGEAGIKINVSNPDYDADKDKLSNAYTDKDVDYLVVVAAMADDIQSKVQATLDAAATAGIEDATQLELVKKYAYTQAFTDWIYLVNDDTGMFGGTNYQVTPEGEDTTYVAEYTVLARELYKTGINSIAVDDTSSTVCSETDAKLAYEGETSILSSENEKSYTIKKQEYVSTTKTADDLEATIYTLTTELGNKISFIVNTYGIHIVMVEDISGSENFGIADSVTEIKDEEETVVAYQLNENYIHDYTVTVDKNDDGVITNVTVEVNTIADFIKNTIKDEKKNDVLTGDQVILFLKDAKDEENSNVNIEKVEKIIKQIIKANS